MSGTFTICGPLETVRVMTLNLVVDPVGLIEITFPLPMAVLYAVTVAVLKPGPSAVRRRPAVGGCWRAMSGMARIGRPEETMIVTGWPRLTCAPAAGSVPITWPLGTVSLGCAVLSGATATGRVSSFWRAAASLRVATEGMVKRSLPLETVSVMVRPRGNRDPAPGSVLMTDPAATVSLNAVPIFEETEYPAWRSRLTAVDSATPASLGTRL